MSLSIKLQSSDGEIFTVDAATVKQMVTIQTMIDHEDEESDEVTPVPTVRAEILEKIIQWTEYHKIEKTNEIAWYTQYFDLDLQKKFEIIIASDYLEIKNLLSETCRDVLINNNWETIKDATNIFHNPKVVSILEGYERDHGYEVMVFVTKEDNEDDTLLEYFDTKVK